MPPCCVDILKKTLRFSPPGYACITSSVLAVLLATLPNAGEHWPAGEVLGWPLLSLGFRRISKQNQAGEQTKVISLNASWPILFRKKITNMFLKYSQYSTFTRRDVFFHKFRWMLLVNLASFFWERKIFIDFDLEMIWYNRDMNWWCWRERERESSDICSFKYISLEQSNKHLGHTIFIWVWQIPMKF